MRVHADKLFINGKIYSMEKEGSCYEALAIKDGKITFIGDNRSTQAEFDADEVIDLGVLYALTDAFLGLIIIPNMIAVVVMVPQVKKAQDEFFNTPGQYYLADKAAKAAKKAAK